MENTNNRNLSFVNTYKLKAQTPLVHFQPDQPGATLRATEVKPKLDSFLLNKAQKDNEDFSDCLIKDTGALNYKIRIIADKDASILNLGFKTPYDIFYGNMGDGPTKKGVLADANLFVNCLNKRLREFIDKYIAEFFAVTNFGTMNNKGFGSFIVQQKELSESQISKALKERYGALKCYRMNTKGHQFKRIKTVYSLLKSGINFHGYQRSLLFLYMHDKYNFGNEKAWLKQQHIAPALGKNPDQNDETSYFVRALLGLGERIEFCKNKVSVSISNSEKTIERLPSPIIFKVIGNSVYMLANRIDENIYGKSFVFKSKMGIGTLKVPEKNDLGDNFIDDFLEFAVQKINTGIADKFVSADRGNVNDSIRFEEVK